jgi:hypothetical protein
MSQLVLGGDEFGQPRGELGWRVVAGRVGWADPVPVPDAEVLVVGEQPPHRAALVAGGAAGTSTLGQVPQRWPVRRRHPKLRQRPSESFGWASGYRRQPSGQVDQLIRIVAGV